MSVSKPEKQPQKTHQLTLSESRNSLIVPLGLGLMLAALGLGALINREEVGAGVFCLVALLQFVTVPALWKRYRQVKQGAAVYVAVQRPPLQMPQIVSIAVVLILTVFVGLCSAFVVYITKTYFNTQTGWTFCGLTLLAVWLFIGYCWYRIFTEKTQAKPDPLHAQPEGVWPPAPLFDAEEGNKD